MITQKKLAEELGLSQQLVSLCFSNPKLVKKDTLDRVLSHAEARGYKINNYARGMKKGRFDNITVIATPLPGRMFYSYETLAGMAETLGAAGKRMSISFVSDAELSDDARMRNFLSNSASDGAVVNYPVRAPEKLRPLLEKYSIPAIWLNSDDERDAAAPDYFQAGRDAALYLLSKGLGKIMLADFSKIPHFSPRDFENGYLSAVKDARIEPFVVPVAQNLRRSARPAAMSDIIKTLATPFGVLCFSESTLNPALAAATQAGLKIGEDAHFVCMGERYCDSAGFDTPTMILPSKEIGKTAAAMLLRKINSGGAAIESEKCLFKLMEKPEPVKG
jgi:DNA-binding LacI/PurR family transcriptional regulator